MAGRINTLAARFSECYAITGSIRQSLRYTKMKDGTGFFFIQFNNRRICLRKNKTDREVFVSTFLNGYHRCPFLLENAPTIVDFGSNIGLTIIDFKQSYPNARIFGAEPDKENYEICRENIKDISNCTVMQTAIWKTEGIVEYGGKDEQSYTIETGNTDQKGTATSLTVDGFLEKNNILRVDYMKMDIEGAEYAVLLESNNNQWLQKTKYLSIEVHDTKTIQKEEGIQQLTAVLENNNFSVYKSSLHWSSLFAINKLFLTA